MIREIQAQTLSDTIRALCIEANTILPQDLRSAIQEAQKQEESPVGRGILGDLIENYEFAESKGLPICQDTGMAVVFIDWGQECHLTGGSLEEIVNGAIWTAICGCQWWRTPFGGEIPTTTRLPFCICGWSPADVSKSP